MNAFSGTASWSLGDKPCCAACAQEAQNNPPTDDIAADAAGAFGVSDFLAQSLAVGLLANRLGLPDGARLVGKVSDFIGAHADEAAAETGSVLGEGVELAAKRLGGTAGKLAAKVEGKAIQLIGVAERHPNILLAAGAVGVGALYLSNVAAGHAVEIANQRALVSEQLSRVSPQEAVAALKSLNLVGASSGLGILGWLALGAGVLGLLWAWKALR